MGKKFEDNKALTDRNFQIEGGNSRYENQGGLDDYTSLIHAAERKTRRRHKRSGRIIGAVKKSIQGRMFRKASFVLAGLVVFATTYSLILPALTLDYDSLSDLPGVHLGEKPVVVEVLNSESSARRDDGDFLSFNSSDTVASDEESAVADERESTAGTVAVVDKTADDEIVGGRNTASGADQSVSKSNTDRVDAGQTEQAENTDDKADSINSHRELLWVDKDADEAEIAQVAEEAFGDQIVKPERNDQEEQVEEESAKDNETVKNPAQEDRETVEDDQTENESPSNVSVDNKENNETSVVENTDEEKSTESTDIAESTEKADPVEKSGTVNDSAVSDAPGTESDVIVDSNDEKEQNVSTDEVSAGKAAAMDEATEETAVDEQPEERIVDENAEVYEPIDQTVTKDGEYSIHVTAGADAQIPADAILTVSEIPYNSLQYYTLTSITKDTLSDASASVVYNRFFDISFVVDGQTVEPKAAVNVEINFNKAQELQEEQKLSVVHFAENQETISEVLENNPAMTADGMVEGVRFETGSFSVFGVVYTVDFHSEDGYEFSIPGGGYVALSEVVKVVGLAEKYQAKSVGEVSVAEMNEASGADEVDESEGEEKVFFSNDEENSVESQDATTANEAPAEESGITETTDTTETTAVAETEEKTDSDDTADADIAADTEKDDTEKIDADTESAADAEEKPDTNDTSDSSDTADPLMTDESTEKTTMPLSMNTGGVVAQMLSQTIFTPVSAETVMDIEALESSDSLDDAVEDNIGASDTTVDTDTDKGKETDSKPESDTADNDEKLAGNPEGSEPSDEEETDSDSDTNNTSERVNNTNGSALSDPTIREFLEDVENVEFSDPSLVWVRKVDTTTTVGQLKEANGLEVQYSAELTEEQIAEINEQTVEAGDWALISVLPFDTEESLTITMKNGDQFVVKVTDAQEITSSEASEIDINKAYMICYDDGENYHILHNDGSQDSISKGGFPHVVEYYVSNTTWAFQYVFKEYDREGTKGYNYYLIRSNDDISSTLAIYEEGTQGEDLVQPSNNNIALLPAEGGGFYLSGYNGYRLAFEDGKFISKKYNEGDPDTGSVMHLFERETLPQYMLNVSTNNSERGVVWCYNPTQVLDGDTVELGYTFEFDNYSTTELYNRFDIMSDSGSNSSSVRHIAQDLYAFPWGERGLNNTYRYKFDYWELNGEHLDPVEYPEKIPAGKLEVPYNGSSLVAHFVYDDTFQATDDQKTDSHVDDMSNWLSDFQARRVPLDETKTQKTAEVYDYENRIYRVDLTTKSNLRTFDGSIDLGFSLDVSNSMLFPADLQPYANLSSVQIRNANVQGNNLNLDTSKTYYIISDKKNRSTVFRIFYKNGSWRYTDGSKNEENIIQTYTTFHAVSDDQYDNNYTYQLYYANADSTGVVRDRFYYLNQSINSITKDLVNIKDVLNIAGASSPSVKVGYNTFNGFVQKGQLEGGERQKNDRRTLTDVAPITPTFENVRGGGTRPDRAIDDAKTLGWTGDTRYLILITDGAPQGGAGSGVAQEDPSVIRGYVRSQAEQIKKSAAEGGQDVKIITIGLSMGDVEEGRKLLYDIADYAPNNGPKMFYLAEKTQDLTNILRQILDLILVDATVEGDITDTVNEAFYLVDKATGLPLQANDTIDIYGNRTMDSTKVAGTVLADGKTVKWNDQIIDNKNGWHGVVYVKAKEDLIGANAVKTNDPDHPAEFVAEKYFTSKSTTRKNFDANETEKLVTRVINQVSPRVNVNELTFPATSTEWTVYLGTQVDPKKQLQLLYENITVQQVINKDGSLHYPLLENSLSDDRIGEGDSQTFQLAPVILEIIRNDPSLSSTYIKNNALDWDAFLTGIMTGTGVEIPYHPYGIEGEDSKIVISLEKTILEGEENDLSSQSPHNTTVVNNTATDSNGDPVDVPAEKYVLTVKYSPDYTHVLPKGQGGTSTENFYTGAYGTGYQGHAAGTETSTNTHTINVYTEPLDVLKKDDHDKVVSGAEFKLYRTAKSGETGVPLSAYDASLTGSYYCISEASSGTDGIAHLAPDDMTIPTHKIPIADGQTAQNLLIPGETYYLIETSAPSGYKKDGTVRVVTVEAASDLFTKVDGVTSVEETNISGTPARPTILYNWNEGVTIIVTELGDTTNTNKATLVNHKTRQAVTLDGGRTYMLRSDSDQSVVAQVIVINNKSVDIRIKKTDMNGVGLSNAVFQMKSVNGSAESDVEGVSGLSTITKEINGETKVFTSAFETIGNEQVFTGLSDGTYRLYELYVPAGYISTFRYIQFTIEAGVLQNVTTESGSSDKVILTAATSNSLALLTIKNEPGNALPATGGPGTLLMYGLGAVVAEITGYNILSKRRKMRSRGRKHKIMKKRWS